MDSVTLDKAKPLAAVGSISSTKLPRLADDNKLKSATLASQSKETAEDASLPAQWSLARRVLFRFVFVYLVLYIAPFFGLLWNEIVPWVGERLFQVETIVRQNGSGDKTYDFVQIFCIVVLAAVVTAIWSFLDRRRPNYQRLYEGTRGGVRYYLALTMILYGTAKFFNSQFPELSLERLALPFGEASPMGLLWAFMGASTAYSMFTGAAEVLGGVLLTARRTTLLGALICIGVMSNVVMLNFCYDVCVKQYSVHLLALAFLLAAPDLRRLVNFFLLNRAAEPVEIRPTYRSREVQLGMVIARTVLVATLVAFGLFVSLVSSMFAGDLAPKPPLHGIWDIEELVVDGQAKPLLVTEKTRWRRLIISYPGMATIQFMGDSRERLILDLDAEQHTFVLTKDGDSTWKATFTYTEPEPGLLILEGTVDGQKVRMELRRFDDSQFLLVKRGFHWINERPFNR